MLPVDSVLLFYEEEEEEEEKGPVAAKTYGYLMVLCTVKGIQGSR
jgi:hypothetical protein